jgi:hypothetical protein
MRSGRRAVRVDLPAPVVGFEHTLDLESCRRLHRAPCGGCEGRVPAALDALGFDISAIVALS